MPVVYLWTVDGLLVNCRPFMAYSLFDLKHPTSLLGVNNLAQLTFLSCSPTGLSSSNISCQTRRVVCVLVREYEVLNKFN